MHKNIRVPCSRKFFVFDPTPGDQVSPKFDEGGCLLVAHICQHTARRFCVKHTLVQLRAQEHKAREQVTRSGLVSSQALHLISEDTR